MKRRHKVYPHPLVEYIPLNLYPLMEGKEKLPFKGTRIVVTEEWKKVKPMLPGQIDELKDTNQKRERLYLLLFNASLIEIKYRGFIVYLLGTKREKNWQLGMVTKKYFYKSKLSFLLLSPEGERLARENLVIEAPRNGRR